MALLRIFLINCLQKMNKYFVVDTNNLISANLIASSVSSQAFDKARHLGILVYSDQTIAEFSVSFIRPKFDKYLSLNKRLKAIKEFKRNGLLVSVNFSIKACRDPNDDMFLELAIAANASCIITGDKDLISLHPFQNIPILSAADFLNQF